MKTETRTKITDFSDHVDAAFDMIEAVMANPEMDSELDGSVVTAIECVETSENGKRVSRETSFEIEYPNKNGTTLPEIERVLVPA